MRRNSPRSPRALLGAASVVALLSGCTVGPDFERPQAPADQTYDNAAMPGTTAKADVHGGEAQHLATGAERRAHQAAARKSAGRGGALGVALELMRQLEELDARSPQPSARPLDIISPRLRAHASPRS